jgi:Family of unknown function (DUF6161)
LITINRGKWGDKSFANADEFYSYLSGLHAAYARIRPHMNQSNGALGQLDQAIQQVGVARSNPPANVQYMQYATNSAGAMHTTDFGLLPEDSADFEFVKTFMDVNAQLAGKLAEQLAGAPNTSVEYQAALIATAYRYPKLTGSKGWSFAQATSDKVRAIDAELARAEGTFKRIKVDAATLLKDSATDHVNQIQKHDELADKQRSEIAESWDALKQVYDAQLALQAPRTYWERQLASHKQGANEASAKFRRAGILSVVIATALLLFIWSVTANKPHDIPLALWVLSGAILGIAFWVIRLYSRLYLSREHLARDAEERVTMIETYLALVQHGRIKDDDLKFVLSSIFRPTEDGLVKDDTLPSPLLDLFQQAKGGK